MTENNAAQPGLTDDEILQVFADVVGNQEDDARFIDVDRDQAIRIARTLLSKLRAESVQAGDLPPYALQTVGPDGTGVVEYYTADQMRAALASAPVAEPEGWRLVPISPTPEMESAGCDVPCGQDDAPAPATVYEAMLNAAPVASAPVANALTQQDVFDRFQFLEGLVNANTYRKIAETAHALYESGAPWPNMEQTIRDLRAELGYVKQYGPRVLPDLCPPATSRDRWMYEQGRLAERASAPVAGEAQPACWIYRTHLESLRDDGADEASVYRGDAGRAIGPDEVPLYAAPQASADAVIPASDVRNAALEEAARIMEQTGKRIAAADIRSLKTSAALSPTQPTEQGERDA